MLFEVGFARSMKRKQKSLPPSSSEVVRVPTAAVAFDTVAVVRPHQIANVERAGMRAIVGRPPSGNGVLAEFPQTATGADGFVITERISSLPLRGVRRPRVVAERPRFRRVQ
jgi:hypothetical protein